MSNSLLIKGLHKTTGKNWFVHIRVVENKGNFSDCTKQYTFFVY